MRYAVLAFALAACSANRARPEFQAYDAYTGALVEKYTEGTIAPEAWDTKYGRNQTIDEMIFLCDVAYVDYEESLYQSGATFNTAMDIAIMGLSAAGAVVTGGASQIFSAATAGVAGIRSTIDKNFYLEQTRFSLIMRMDALRLATLANIEARKAESITAYPFSAALLDVQRYYQAGTLMSALKASSADALDGLRAARRDYEAVKGTMQ